MTTGAALQREERELDLRAALPPRSVWRGWPVANELAAFQRGRLGYGELVEAVDAVGHELESELARTVAELVRELEVALASWRWLRGFPSRAGATE